MSRVMMRGVQGQGYDVQSRTFHDHNVHEHSVVDISLLCSFVPQNEEDLLQYQQEIGRLWVLPADVRRAVAQIALARLKKLPDSPDIPRHIVRRRVHTVTWLEVRTLQSVVASKAKKLLLDCLKTES